MDRPPNYFARFAAVGGLIVVFLLVIVVLASSGGGGGGSDSSDGSSSGTVTNAPSNDPEIRKALAKGEYTVKEGDTLTSISEATGIDIQTLIELNPDTDPQTLTTGATIKLH